MKKQGYRKYVKHGQGGFTLIELLIVVAIIGILAAIAIPRYQDYIARSQMGSALQEISPLRTAAEELFLSNRLIDIDTLGAPGTVNSGDGETQFAGTSQTNFGIISMPDPEGTDTMRIQHSIGDGTADTTPAITGVDLEFIRDETGNWSCEVVGERPSGWKDSYIPGNCGGANLTDAT